MKRVLTFLAIMLLPLSVMAMTPISDSDMSKVTGQAGVSINMDITMNVTFGEMGWGDSDGLNGATDGGWIGLDSLNVDQMHIWPRTDFTMEAAAGGAAADGGWTDLQFLTIDVVTVADTAAAAGLPIGPFFFQGQAGNVNNEVTAVRIGIPTLTITMAQMTGNVVLGPVGGPNTIGGIVNGDYYAGKTINTPAFNQLMGMFDVSGLNMAMAPNGSVLISAHGNGSMAGALSGNTLYGSGVTIELDDVEVAYLLLDNASWGDLEGIEDVSLATSTAASQAAAVDTEGLNGEGWVGLADLAIENLTINGKVAIDVATCLASDNTTLLPVSAAGAAAFVNLVEAYEDIYNTIWGQDGGNTFVSIGIVNGFSIEMDQMGARVELGSTAALGQEMGDIYVGDMKMTIFMNRLTYTQSHIHIFAH